LLIATLAGCQSEHDPPPGVVAPITVTSTAFDQGQPIPIKHTRDGEDVSPALSWNGVPSGAKELVLICDDPNAPGPQPWVHWVIYKIPGDADGLPESVPGSEVPGVPKGALQGENSWGRMGYNGPQPPRGDGPHHYFFKLYALDAPLDLKPGLDKDALLKAMEGHVIGQGELVGTYER
jgi:hypothetical protein